MPAIKEFREIDGLTPSDFELFVRDVFAVAGWSDLEVTKSGREYKHGDGGVDIFGKKEDRRFAIEVKQRQAGSLIDVKSLNQLVTGAKLAKVANMILVTNSYFTSEVRIRALRLGVELVDRDGLQNLWIEKHSEIGRRINKLRGYQERVIEEVLDEFKNGKQRFLIEMATGLGKTITAAHLVRRIIQEKQKKIRVLFLAHQVEILLQSLTAFKNVLGIGNHSYSACFDGADPEQTDFVFGSFDTLFIKLPNLKKETFDIIIIDEAHHTPAETYAKVVAHFKPELLLGLTATPFRTDAQDVLAFFGGSKGHVGKFDLAWALRNKKLAFPKYTVLLDDLDQNRLDQLKFGLSISDLDKRLFLHKKEEEIIRLIEETISCKNIPNPKGIVFCHSINHIKYLIQFFPPGSATFVHSKMIDIQRRANIRDFREGSYKYILVCDLFNEGIDIPETNILVFLRYTASRVIWLQQLGRGLRKTKNKDYVHVLDFVGSLERLYEIQEFKNEIDCEPPDPEELEPTSPDLPFHDSTIEITYDRSAAQVLKLIEDLQYRLKSRSQAIELIREYWDKKQNLPEIENLESELPDISCDQIATLFDSYLGYLEVAISEGDYRAAMKATGIAYAEDYYSKYNVAPSMQAISINSQYKGLPKYTENEADELFEGQHALELYLKSNKHKSDSIQFNATAEVPKEVSTPLVNDPENLVFRYINSINNLEELHRLPKEDLDKIHKIYQSEFYFLRLLRENRNNNPNHGH